MNGYSSRSGGLGVDRKHWTYVCDALGARDLSLWANVTAANDFGSHLIMRYGTEEQRRKYLPLIEQGKLKVAYALQETDA